MGLLFIALSDWMIMNNKWRSWPNLRSHLGIFLEAAALAGGASGAAAPGVRVQGLAK